MALGIEFKTFYDAYLTSTTNTAAEVEIIRRHVDEQEKQKGFSFKEKYPDTAVPELIVKSVTKGLAHTLFSLVLDECREFANQIDHDNIEVVGSIPYASVLEEMEIVVGLNELSVDQKNLINRVAYIFDLYRYLLTEEFPLVDDIIQMGYNEQVLPPPTNLQLNPQLNPQLIPYTNMRQTIIRILTRHGAQ